MRIFHSPPQFSRDVQMLARGHSVGLTIGNFDAVHLGHAELFRRLDEALDEFPAASRLKGLVTFWPHPRPVLSNISPSERRSRDEFFTVFSLRDRLAHVARAGFDFTYVIRFHRAFAAQAPEEFVRKHLVEPFHPKVVVVGDDWSFGKGRAGTTERLRALGVENGFRTEIVSGVTSNGMRVSTSLVKQAVRDADFPLLQRLLGRDYSVSGRVVHGAKIGRTLGYPTANLELRGILTPPDGIYAGWADVDGRALKAAVYIGTRPTFGGTIRRIEAYLLETEEGEAPSLYGKRLEVRFVSRIREDRQFANADELRDAIDRDVAEVRARLEKK